MEGFTDVEYVKDWTTYTAKAVNENRADFTQDAAWTFLPSVESGGSVIALAGMHVGCYELFANERVQGIRDLKGKTVAIPSLWSPDHMLLSSMLAYVGVNPGQDVKWISGPKGVDAMALYLEGKADAYLAFAPQGSELRAKKAGRVIVNIGVDRPWSQYFCCVVVGNREYVGKYPNATKRALRAFLKAADICAQDPQRAARMLVDRGFEPRYEVALEVLKELPYNRWRESNPEDTLRFYALRLHEIGMIKSTPNKVIAQGTDWRFLNELKRELKA
jgi:NitT/TauT family transport system substrate-binding protein